MMMMMMPPLVRRALFSQLSPLLTLFTVQLGELRNSLVVHSSVDIPPGANSKKRLKPELLYTEVARTVSAAVIAEMSYST